THDFASGDVLVFNVYFKQTGPNPVQKVETARWLYIEPDTESSTQARIVSDFLSRLRTEKQKAPLTQPPTMTVGDHQWVSAFNNVGGVNRRATPDDLTALREGKLIAYVVVQMTYLDRGVPHHLHKCHWLQPPASPPGGVAQLRAF